MITRPDTNRLFLVGRTGRTCLLDQTKTIPELKQTIPARFSEIKIEIKVEIRQMIFINVADMVQGWIEHFEHVNSLLLVTNHWLVCWCDYISKFS